MNNTCFVIMPIGTQTIGNITISEEELHKKYNYVIKRAILKADPNLEVIRADEELNPSSISNDIFTKLMHSRFVIADITYPNPNVFYELGIRHAIKTGTILIRENINFTIPFDISHMRYIEYTQEPSGMDKLSNKLKHMFEFYEANSGKPDNQFLELCSHTNFVPITFGNNDSVKQEAITNIFTTSLTNPELMKAITNDSLSKEAKQKIVLEELSKNPDSTKQLIQNALKSGMLKI